MRSSPVSTRATVQSVGLAVLLSVANPLGAEALAVSISSDPQPSASLELAQATPVLSETATLIQACRRTNRSVEVFSNIALTPANRVGTFAPNTQVTLSGITGQGIAQVYYLTTAQTVVVGWVNSAFLTSCDQPPPVGTKLCYRVNSALAVRDRPGTVPPSTVIGDAATGSVVYATTNPATTQIANGRTWLQITYRNGSAWISSTGANNQGSNLTQLTNCP